MKIKITYSVNPNGEKYETRDITIKSKFIPREGEIIKVNQEHSILSLKVEDVIYTPKSKVKLYCQLIHKAQKED